MPYAPQSPAGAWNHRCPLAWDHPKRRSRKWLWEYARLLLRGGRMAQLCSVGEDLHGLRLARENTSRWAFGVDRGQQPGHSSDTSQCGPPLATWPRFPILLGCESKILDT